MSMLTPEERASYRAKHPPPRYDQIKMKTKTPKIPNPRTMPVKLEKQLSASNKMHDNFLWDEIVAERKVSSALVDACRFVLTTRGIEGKVLLKIAAAIEEYERPGMRKAV